MTHATPGPSRITIPEDTAPIPMPQSTTRSISSVHTERLIKTLAAEDGVPSDVIHATIHHSLTMYWRPSSESEYKQCEAEHSLPYEVIQSGELIVRLKRTVSRLYFIEAIRLTDGPAKVEHYYAFDGSTSP